MLLDALLNFASNSHCTPLKLQLEREILRNYNVELSTFMAPIVKTSPSYIKDSRHALEIVLEFHFLGQDKLVFTMDIKHFFDQRTVKEPSSETLPRSAKLVLIIASS